MISLNWKELDESKILFTVEHNDEFLFKGYFYGVYEDNNPYISFYKGNLKDLKRNKTIHFSEESRISAESAMTSLGFYHGSMSEDEIKDFVSIFKDYLDFEVSYNSWDCECCGVVCDCSIHIRNKEIDTSVNFHEDGHFGNSYLPTSQDLFNFLITGSCQSNYNS